MQKIQIAQFEGPLELLLELIEREKLDISEISLSQVTEQYLDCLKEIAETNPDELADFLVVASKLLLIKSRILLPELTVDDDDATDLALQLRMYKEFYEASKALQKMIVKRRFLFPRMKPAIPITTVFNPPKHLTPSHLHELFLSVLKAIEPVIELPREIVRRTVSLQEKIANISEMLTKQAEVNFSSLMSKASSKMDVIVTFLALLELVKRRSVVVHQHGNFKDIVVHQPDQELNEYDPSA